MQRSAFPKQIIWGLRGLDFRYSYAFLSVEHREHRPFWSIEVDGDILEIYDLEYAKFTDEKESDQTTLR